jgi:hypothetical protein
MVRYKKEKNTLRYHWKDVAKTPCQPLSGSLPEFLFIFSNLLSLKATRTKRFFLHQIALWIEPSSPRYAKDD